LSTTREEPVSVNTAIGITAFIISSLSIKGARAQKIGLKSTYLKI